MNRTAQSVVFALTLLLVGCATTQNVAQIGELRSVGGTPHVLVMQPDVKFYRHTAGGVLEPQAEWTEAGRTNLVDALNVYGKKRGMDLVLIDQKSANDELELAYDRLHGAVGRAVLTHYFRGGKPLPSKGGKFDWSLGPGIQELGRRYGTDYILFTYYREVKATGGRSLLAALALVAGGVAMATDAQFGFASLVDLRTGNVVWFNKVDVGTGDLRESDGATKVVAQLYRGMPGSK